MKHRIHGLLIRTCPQSGKCDKKGNLLGTRFPPHPPLWWFWITDETTTRHIQAVRLVESEGDGRALYDKLIAPHKEAHTCWLTVEDRTDRVQS